MSVYEAFAINDVLAPLERAHTLTLRRSTLRHPLVWIDLFASLIVLLLLGLGQAGDPAFASLLTLAWPLLCANAGCYSRLRLQRYQLGPSLVRVMGAALLLVAGLGALSYLSNQLISPSTVNAALPGLVVGSGLGRLVLPFLWKPNGNARRIVVVGDENSVRPAAARLVSKTSPHQVLAAVVETDNGQDLILEHGAPVLPGLERLETAVDLVAADTVIFAGNALDAATVQKLAWKLESRRVEVAWLPSLPDLSAARMQAQVHNGLPLLWVRQPARAGWSCLVKHGLDRLLAGVLLLLLAPLLAVLAVAVRVSSPGAAIFKQTRVGKQGRTFTMYKFRTMVTDAELQREVLLDNNQAQGPLFKIRLDPRITSLGRWLRKYSLDELPQLFNVLKGEMSLVGPRPPLPEEVDTYDQVVRRRLLVRPGLTGLWQVSGRSDLSWKESVNLDLTYVDNISLGYDASILGKTVGAVAKGQGAY